MVCNCSTRCRDGVNLYFTALSKQNTNLGSNSFSANSNANLSSSFNSGLNTLGLNNSYASTSPISNLLGNGGGGLSISGIDGGGGSGSRSLGYQGTTDGVTTGLVSGNGGSSGGNGGANNKLGYVNNGGGAPFQSDLGSFRKPSRLEALPGVGTRSDKGRKKSGPPMLNTMGTF